MTSGIHSQVCGTHSPAWRALDALTAPTANSYCSALIHLHLYVTTAETAAASAEARRLADLPTHPLPEEEAGDSSSAQPQDADDRPASFTSSVWRSLKRPDSQNHAQPASTEEPPQQSDAAIQACCSAVALPGQLVAAWSFDLASLQLLATGWKEVAGMNCSYPPATLLLELRGGIYTLPGMLPDASRPSNGEVAIPTADGYASSAPRRGDPFPPPSHLSSSQGLRCACSCTACSPAALQSHRDNAGNHAHQATWLMEHLQRL